jgi:hypothetical protein
MEVRPRGALSPHLSGSMGCEIARVQWVGSNPTTFHHFLFLMITPAVDERCL